jgi:putative endonuclease
MSDKKIIGKKAEDVACSFLQRNGLATIERNYNCRYGEIDLIMDDDGTLVFVEVRYRSSSKFGNAVDSVDQAKQQKLVFAANHYLQNRNKLNPCRFDVVALSPGSPPEWIIDAFMES